MQGLIQSVAYFNFADEPEIVKRTVTVSKVTQNCSTINVKYFQLLIDDGEFNQSSISYITIVPVADHDPIINPDGHPNMTENEGPVSIIYNIIDDDQVDRHQLIYQINISLCNPKDEVSIRDTCDVIMLLQCLR